MGQERGRVWLTQKERVWVGCSAALFPEPGGGAGGEGTALPFRERAAAGDSPPGG